MISDRCEGGFFSNVTTLHPLARTNKFIEYSNNSHIVQFGWKSSYSFLNKIKIFKIISTVFLMGKLLFIFPFELKKKKIDVIRATDPYYMGLLGYYYSLILRIPFVISIHSDYDKRYQLDGAKGSFSSFGSRKIGEQIEAFTLKKCSNILPIRKYMIDLLSKKYHLPKEKFYVFPHGIDLNIFDKTEFIDIYQKFKIKREKKIISFVGRISKENYVYDLIEVAKILNKTKDDFVFLITGGGNEFNEVNKLVKDMDFIKCIGFQNKRIVNNIQKQSFISMCLMGGFSLIEACAAANPIISYDVEWHEELVNKETGFLIAEGDLTNCAEKVIELLNEEKKAYKLGLNARKLIEGKHEISKTYNIKSKFYRNLLNGK